MNYAIIGCGVIAFTHATALKKLQQEEGFDANLYAVCDIIPEKADQFALDHKASKVYYNHHELLADPAVDIVCVCVPSGIHGEICIDASRAGKSLICEKPMEITPERIAQVTAEIEKNHTKMQCVFQRRMMPAAIAVREAVRNGSLGRICMAEAQLNYYRDQAYYNSAGWRGTWELDGGGALMNQGVHGVDLILWMLDEPVKSLYGKAETMCRNIAVEDTAAAVLQMESGALCVIESSTTAYPGYTTKFTIYGEKGTVSFDDNGILVWNFLDAEHAPVRPDAGEVVGGAQNPVNIGIYGHVKLLQDIGEALRDDRAPMIPPQDAQLAVKVICSIYESTKTGQPVFF